MIYFKFLWLILGQPYCIFYVKHNPRKCKINLWSCIPALPSASQCYYHIITSPKRRKSLKSLWSRQKERTHFESLNENWQQQQRQHLSVNVRRQRETLYRGKALWQSVLVVIVMLQQDKSETFFSLCDGKTARFRCSSCFGFLPHPSAPARRLSCHCGCGMLETQWNKREPKLHFPWHQSGIVGPGGRRCGVRENSTGAFAPTAKSLQLRKQRQRAVK